MGSLLVTILFGIAFGNGFLFEILPETNEVVLTPKVQESTVEVTPQPESDIPEEETPTLTQTPEEEVLGEAVELLTPIPTETEVPTVTNTPTTTPTPKLTSTTVPSQTPTPTLTLTPSPTPLVTATPAPSSLNTFDLINQYAGQYGVDPGLLRKIADCESHFNPNAVGARGLYVGMFQFGEGSWQSVRKLMGLDPNPALRSSGEESIKTAAFAISKGKASMWPNCSQ